MESIGKGGRFMGNSEKCEGLENQGIREARCSDARELCSGDASVKSKRWDPFPRNDPLKDRPGGRRMSKGKTEFDEHGLSARDIAHAKRLVKLARDDDDVDLDMYCFEIFDVARVLKNYRERYERAEHALKMSMMRVAVADAARGRFKVGDRVGHRGYKQAMEVVSVNGTVYRLRDDEGQVHVAVDGELTGEPIP
jgi:hypothetical protein